MANISLSSNAPSVNGFPQVNADGSSTHTITIQKQDNGNNVSGSEALYVTIAVGAIVVSNKMPNLANGQATINIGPTTLSQTTVIEVSDQAGVVSSGSIVIRFF